jgi:tetratricopeptide (TPR) repeat protein
VKHHQLSTKDRLRLLSRVCQAVHHAHTKGVIHRDLKPGNILIAPDGSPKILDFGVARATDSDLQATTCATESDAVIGTLPYMAPEQASGRTRELDTSSDVYALGVIAYELLDGRMPYVLEGKPLHEAVRVICEEEPSRLSRVDRTLGGDVETIVAKALEKDKSRRYQTAGEFAEDVRRYLDYEPITARPRSTWYNLKKFARRNKALVVGTAAVMLVLLLGFVGTSVGLFSANRQRAQKQRLLADSYAQAATLAMQRGNWAAAAENFQQAITAGNADPVAMRLGLIRVLHNQDRSVDALQLIERLRTDGALGPGSPHRGEALLLEGNLLWISDAPRAQALFRQALDAGLSPAAQHYARGMVAPRVPDAIAELQTCLNLDPYYHEANRSLAMLQVMMGQLDDARARTRAWMLNFPDDPIAPLALALIATAQGNRDEAHRLISDCKADPATKAQLEEAISLLAGVFDWDRMSSLGTTEQVAFAMRFMKLATSSGFGGGGLQALRLPPTPACLGNSLTDVWMVIRQYVFNPGSEADLRGPIADLADRYPTGWVLMMHANLQMEQSWDSVRDVAQRAAEAPSLVRVRRAALTLRGLACANLWLNRDRRDPNSRYAPETYDAFKAALREGPIPGEQSQLVVRVFMRLRDFRTARTVAEDAQTREPKSAYWPLQLSIIEYLDGNYGSSIHHARKALSLSPDDAAVKTVLAKAQHYFDDQRVGPPDDIEGVFDFGPVGGGKPAPASQP